MTKSKTLQLDGKICVPLKMLFQKDLQNSQFVCQITKFSSRLK